MLCPFAKSLRACFTRFVTLLSLLAVVTSGFFGFAVARNILVYQIEQRLELALSERRKLIHQFIEAQEAQLRLIASRTHLRELLDQNRSSQISLEQLRASGERILRDATESSDGMQEIWIADHAGQPLIASANARYERTATGDNILALARQGFYLSAPRLIDNSYRVLATVPVLGDQREPIAYLIAAIDAAPLRKLLLAPIGHEKTGEVVLAEQEGEVVSIVFPSHASSVKHRVAVDSEAALANASKGVTGTIHTVNSSGAPAIAAYGPLGYRGWILVARVDADEAYAPIRALRYKLLGVVAGSGIFMAVLAWLFAWSITKPILSLERAATELARGNLSSRVKLDRHDELGALGRTFNEMALSLEDEIQRRMLVEAELRNLNDSLETRIEERSELLKKSQEQLRQAERMASIGALAAGIAHEINNPVGAMVLTVENALTRKDDAADQEGMRMLLERTCQKVLAHAQRCQNIVKGILQFSRRESTEKQPQDLNSVVRGAIASLRETSKLEGVEIALNLAPVLKTIYLNAFEIEQVLINLLQNAVDAGSEKITVTTASIPTGVRLSVQDDGAGIAEETLRHVFDPFYTTRLHEGGTGLGLSIVHGIVASHSGKVYMESEIGRGTRAVVEFFEQPEAERLVA